MTTFYMGDCLEVMKDLSDNSVDCFICDLPYGQLAKQDPKEETEEQKKARLKKCHNAWGGGCPWDIKIDLTELWKQIKRLAKDDHTPVLMFCNTRFGIDLINSNPSWFRYDLVWDKGRGVSFLSANKQPMRSHEMIYVFSKAGAYYRRVDISGNFTGWKAKEDTDNKHTNVWKGGMPNGWKTTGNDGTKRCPVSVIYSQGKSVRGAHPTEKPEELYEWLLRRYVPDGGTVLDPTAGSFNSCFVADRLGYKAIGIEKDETFFNKAVERLNPPQEGICQGGV